VFGVLPPPETAAGHDQHQNQDEGMAALRFQKCACKSIYLFDS